MLGDTCPACDYSGNTQPVATRSGELNRCSRCGATWRVINRAMPSAPVQSIASGLHARQATTVTGAEPVARPSIATVMIAGFLFLPFVIAAAFWVLQPSELLAPGSDRVLEVSEVRFDERHNGRGDRIVTVRGTVRNTGGQMRSVPRLEILLKNDQNTVVARWRHRSALRQLQPGGVARFASSVQNEDPSVSRVEARLVP